MEWKATRCDQIKDKLSRIKIRMYGAENVLTSRYFLPDFTIITRYDVGTSLQGKETLKVDNKTIFMLFVV